MALPSSSPPNPTGRPKILPRREGPRPRGVYATAPDLAARYKVSLLWIARRMRDDTLPAPFPQPVWRSGNRRLWLWSEIRQWERVIAAAPRIPAGKKGATYLLRRR
jgi:hypothetical protein